MGSADIHTILIYLEQAGGTLTVDVALYQTASVRGKHISCMCSGFRTMGRALGRRG